MANVSKIRLLGAEEMNVIPDVKTVAANSAVRTSVDVFSVYILSPIHPQPKL